MSAAGSLPLDVVVTGVALWTPLLPGWDIARGVYSGHLPAPTTPQSRVAPALLAPTERRRAPDTVAIALEVAARACEMAGTDPRALPSVFASTHGDLGINDYMCATLAANPALCSPTKFHNSVHNAAAGYWTIGTGCTQASTALTAWQDTFAAGLLEAAVQAVADDTPVLCVAYDVTAKGPLATVTPSEGLLAAAVVVAPATRARHGIARLSCQVVAAQDGRGSLASAAPLPAPWAALVPRNAMTSCLPLFAQFAAGSGGTLHWGVGRGTALVVDVATLQVEAAA